MFKKLWNFVRRTRFPTPPPFPIPEPTGIFSTDRIDRQISDSQRLENVMTKAFQVPVEFVTPAVVKGTAMDNSGGDGNAIKGNFQGNVVPLNLLEWYASQSFIGYQMCSIMAQHWLVAKACLMPAKDAVRKGYEITINDGSEIDKEVLDEMRNADVKYHLNANLIELVDQGRVFGIRIAMFKVESEDPEYFEKPFNPDGIMPGSYKGISQIDPYWITPELDFQAAGDPSSIHFYEPTWWRINGRRYHRTHLIIFRNGQVPDILKPTYIYGGIPVPQKIYERVYSAERTANEAPMLALTKRCDVMKVDLTKALANQASFDARMQFYAFNRDNYGLKMIDLVDEFMQFDTGLADLDAIIMTQYQIVAAIAGVPAVKLMGTSPKGFNASGTQEEDSYHEELESIQAHDLTPLIERHHLILIRSEIAPKYGMEPFSTSVVWNPLKVLSDKEQAEVNKLKADTGAVLSASGAVDAYDERERIIGDPSSGYSGITDEVPIGPDLIESDPQEKDA
jgi:phage-related protein (TIGR01555 family)